MQLTPRTLSMALGACLAGGLILGVMAVISPTVGATSPGPEAPGAASAYSQADLGDVQISFPTPEMNVATSMPIPTPSATSPSIPRPAATTIGASARPSPAPTATPNTSSVTTAANSGDIAKPSGTQPAAPTRTDTPAKQTPRPKVKAPAALRSAPQPLHSWKPPHLGLGVTDISTPSLSSGARVHVTVMCTPSTGCTATGRSLTVTPDALRVSVTWSARPVSRWRAWSDTSAYTSPAKG